MHASYLNYFEIDVYPECHRMRLRLTYYKPFLYILHMHIIIRYTMHKYIVPNLIPAAEYCNN